MMSQPELGRLRPAHTAVLSEGSHGADLVIQHPSVKGFCLAIAIGGGRASLYWAQFDSLDRKDELDAARDASHLHVGLHDDGPVALAGAVRQQLEAPLSVVETSRFGKRSTVEIKVPERAGTHGMGRRVWIRREQRVLPLLPAREARRHESFLSMDVV